MNPYSAGIIAAFQTFVLTTVLLWPSLIPLNSAVAQNRPRPPQAPTSRPLPKIDYTLCASSKVQCAAPTFKFKSYTITDRKMDGCGSQDGVPSQGYAVDVRCSIIAGSEPFPSGLKCPVGYPNETNRQGCPLPNGEEVSFSYKCCVQPGEDIHERCKEEEKWILGFCTLPIKVDPGIATITCCKNQSLLGPLSFDGVNGVTNP